MIRPENVTRPNSRCFGNKMPRENVTSEISWETETRDLTVLNGTEKRHAPIFPAGGSDCRALDSSWAVPDGLSFPQAHGPSVRKKYLNGFSLQREAHLGIEVGLAPGPLSGVFRAFCPPPRLAARGKTLTAVFFSSSRGRCSRRDRSGVSQPRPGAIVFSSSNLDKHFSRTNGGAWTTGPRLPGEVRYRTRPPGSPVRSDSAGQRAQVPERLQRLQTLKFKDFPQTWALGRTVREDL